MKKFLIIAAVLGLVAVVAKKLSADRSDWTNLTEDEARQRLHDRFPDRMPDEKKDAVTDKIVTKMKEKGALIDLTDVDEVEGADEEAASTN